MDSEILETLPPLSRLALAYAPAVSRYDWLTVLALDTRLAGVVRLAREPVLAQLKLAWWRDRLAQDVSDRPIGEPLLARLGDWQDGGKPLIALVNGWEALLGEPPLSGEAVKAFASGRVAMAGTLAERLRCDRHGAEVRARRWALADLALHSSADTASAGLRDLALEAAAGLGRCERAMRPLAVLEKINQRANRLGSVHALGSPFALLIAIRVGLIGR